MNRTCDTVEIYTDAAGLTRWRRLCPVGNNLDHSTRGYNTDDEAEADMLAHLPNPEGVRVVRLGDTPPPEDAPPPPPGDLPTSHTAPSGPYTAPEDQGGTDVPLDSPGPSTGHPDP